MLRKEGLSLVITTFITDGLGNQMFQYAFARSLQLKTNNELQFALSSFKNDAANREYGLSNLCIDDSVRIISDKEAEKKMLFVKIFSKIHSLTKSDESKRIIDKKLINSFGTNVYDFFDISKVKFSKDICISGQYQNHRLFEEYKETIKKELKVKVQPSEQNEKKLKEISSENSVCVHIRRGDYLDARWAHLNVCDDKYYYEAMKTISEKTENPVFYVFSNTHDDIEWIKNCYDFSQYNVKYVDLNNPDYEELRLMYSCNHFIVSNSTFSWWAQYLGEHENKLVVAPSKWNKRENVDDTGIYMDNWILIDVSKGS